MGLHEDTRNASPDRRPRQHGNELALAARGGALPAGQLHRVGGIEHDRAAGVAHRGEPAHVEDEVVVAEAEAALADEDLLVAGASRLLDDVLHLPGREELALLDVERLALHGGIADEVRLPAEERRRLHHVDHRRDLGERRVLVHVGEHRDADLALYGTQYFQTFFHAGAAVALARGAVRLVEGALEDVGHAESSGGLFQLAGDIDAELLALQRVRTGNEKERPVQADVETAEFHAATTESVPPGRWARARCRRAASTYALKSGWPSRGVEVNSGWNCTPMKNGWPGSSMISGRFSLGVRAETL